MGRFDETAIAFFDTSSPFKVFKVGSTCHCGDTINSVSSIGGGSLLSNICGERE